MAKNKLTVDFSNFAEYAEKLDQLGGDLKATAQEALQESKDYVTENLERDMKGHKRSGRTEASIKDESKVVWEGMTASVDVGFDIAHGGLASIFLMYGTPKMAKDQKLYNDIYGATTKRKIKEMQEEIFEKAIKKRMGG